MKIPIRLDTNLATYYFILIKAMNLQFMSTITLYMFWLQLEI